jgi:hypothetical protein
MDNFSRALQTLLFLVWYYISAITLIVLIQYNMLALLSASCCNALNIEYLRSQISTSKKRKKTLFDHNLNSFSNEAYSSWHQSL